MRITNNTLNNGFLRNLSRNLKQMQKYQNQLSSGKLVSRPSDDPLLVGKIMSMDNNIALNEQYNSNISDTIGWTKTQDTALGDATKSLQRIKDLIIYGANSTLSETDREAINSEVKATVDGLVDVLNTNFDGRYVFGGQMTLSKPFSIGNDGALTYDGDSNNVQREISQGVVVDLITDGKKLMSAENVTGDNQDLGKLLSKVVDILGDFDNKGGTDALTGENGLLGDMEKHIDNVVRVRTQIGAIHNRLESAEGRNQSENLNLKELLSEREDIDVAEKYMEFMVMKATYSASLSIGAQILQPSLLDYLR